MAVPWRRIGLVVLALFVLVVVVVGGVGAAVATGVIQVEQPTVESFEAEWGEVTNDTTVIETSIVVTNPNPIGVPELVAINYSVAMNDVTVATGERQTIGLSTGTNEIVLRTEIDNGKIPAWWATHINNGEETTVAIRPRVSALFITRELPTRTRTVETDILGALNREENRSFTAGDRTLLIVTGTNASWGEATRERTPLSFSATMHNPSGAELEFSELRFSMTMNGIEVASGSTDGRVTIAPGETETVKLDLLIDNTRLDEWWASHIRNGEATNVSVDVVAVTERDGETRTIPLSFLSPSFAFETDILGGGGAQVRRLDTGADLDFQRPTLESLSTTWSAVDSETTRFTAEAIVNNPNEEGSPITDLLRLDLGFRVTMNDVTVAEAETTGERLEPGENTIELGDTITEREIQSWWVTHVNGGERTRLTVEPRVTADLGFTSLPVETTGRNETITTDILGGLNSTGGQAISLRERTVFRIQETSAVWGEATRERTPIDVTVHATNPSSETLTVTEIGYTVRMNDVTLANDTSSVDATFEAGSSDTIEATIALDNSKLGEWWVSHVENGGQTTVETSFYVVIEWRGITRRVPIEGLDSRSTIETGFIGG